jgi:hypothetical protein
MLYGLMRWTALVLGLAVLAQGAEAPIPQACRWYVTAKAGDTCNSLAAAWGVTYAQFIHNNPNITSCYLTAGTRNCVDDRDALLPITSTATSMTRPTSGTLPPPTGASGTRSSTAATPMPSVSGFTRDGRCGPQGGSQTCIGSEYGDCCSPEGWCGASDEHCGVGCILGYGLCGISPLPSSSGPSNTTTSSSTTATIPTTSTPAPNPPAQTTITITAVSSTILTFFSLVPQTQTTNITLTQISLATSTAVVTRTQEETTTVTVAQTSGCAVNVTVTAGGVTPTESSIEVSATSTSAGSTPGISSPTDTPTNSLPSGSSASSAPSPTEAEATSSCKRVPRPTVFD